MHPLFGKRGVMLAGLFAVGLAAVTPTVASAKPEPGARRNFRLFSGSLGALTVNRIYCGLATTGEVCVDSTNSSTIGGGFWPKGTADQYVFNSGLQLAGVIQGAKSGSNPWGGDTTGAFFFDPKGTTQHGQEVQPLYNSQNPEDNANWPAAARVPQGDATAALFDPLLQGRIAASQGDVWWLSWEGNPTQNAGRPHPLGVLVETRGLGWNFPTGNEDIVYFIYTFYNITSTNAADYAAVRPDMQPILLQQAQAFQAQNNAAFGITLPAGGFTIGSLYAAFGTDMDVANAGSNYSSVNLPFALGYTYDQSFGRPAGWTFDPAIFSAPFFAGSGFVGVKYLKSPSGPGQIQLFSNTTNGGTFPDPRDVRQLFRYLSGNVSAAAGDAQCNQGDPTISRICYVNNGTASDSRFFQSSTALTLAPGQFGSIVVAYIFAAPVITGSVNPSAALQQKPGNPLLLDPKTPAAATALANNGANQVDSLMGFRGWSDLNGDCATVQPTDQVGCAQEAEFRVVPRSLLGKSNTAQAVFNGKFLLPFAPESPDFFLVPGDNQVTVLWRPSPSETTGDPFFQIAKLATVPDPITGVPGPNALYDPNYRQFDVEGYRIYRGRVDAPNALTLLVQFDYAGTTIKDFAGQVNPVINCAPEINVGTGTPACPFDTPFPTPGTVTQARTKFVTIPLAGVIVQVPLGGRATLATTPPTAILLVTDTAVTGGGTAGSCAPSACPELSDNGVPFVFVDKAGACATCGVRNNFRYFYSVTAFDVNSFQSGPSNLESPRLTKSTTPTASASNFDNQATTSNAVFGRNVARTDKVSPTLDASGKFSKMPAVANGWSLSLASFVKQLIAAPGAVVARLDSIQLGSAHDNAATKYFVTINPGTSEQKVVVPIVQDQTSSLHTGSVGFTGITVDQALAARFGGSSAYSIPGNLTASLEGNYYTGAYGRGCINSATGFGSTALTCDYNGARWFDGPSPDKNETKADPTAPGNQANAGTPTIPANFNNAGGLAGVTTIYEARGYQTVQNTYRSIEGILGGASRAADFNVYWGAAGKVDSVIDVTHNVVVPFIANRIGGGWGILNQAATTAAGSSDTRPTVLTLADWGCVPPLKTYAAAQSLFPCAAGTTYTLSNTAVPGSIALLGGNTASGAASRTTAPPAGNGFTMYLPGHIFSFVLAAGVPAAGTVWTMRSYIGAINGGKGGPGGNEGPYVFTPRVRTFSAVGAEVRFSFDVANQVLSATRADLDKVHTVPDPYFVTSEFEQSTDTKIIKFVNLPNDAIIRIYSSSGVLVNIIEHHATQFGGTEDWNVRNRNNQVVASGVYFYHIEAGDARRVGRFTIVNFAQ